MESMLFFSGSKSYKGRKWHDSNIRVTVERTPGTVASINFRKYMLMLGIDKTQVDSYSIEVLNMEKSRFMNMRTLAAVYLFMHDSKIFIESDVKDAYARRVFSDENMDKYILPLLPETSSKQSKIYIRERKMNADVIELNRLQSIIQFRATFVRYMMVVLKYRSSGKELTPEEAKEILENYYEILLEEQEDAYLSGSLSTTWGGERGGEGSGSSTTIEKEEEEDLF